MSTIVEKLQQLKNIKNDLKEKINAKGGSITDTTPFSEYAGQVDNLSGGGGVALNATIEEYKLTGGYAVKAGDCVKCSYGNSLTVNSSNNSCYYEPSCVELKPDKIFVAHSYGSTQQLYGTILTVSSNGNITPKTFCLNSTDRSCYGSPCCVLLEENKILILHAFSSSQHLYGTIVEIYGIDTTNINMAATSSVCLDDTYETVDGRPSCLLLEENKVFMTFEDGGSNGGSTRLTSAILTINGASISLTSRIIIDVKPSTATEKERIAYPPTCLLLSNNKVFVAHSSSESRNGAELYGTIVTINGTSMSYKCNLLNAESNSCTGRPSCVLLNDGRVFITHPYKTYRNLHGTIVTINGTSATGVTHPIKSLSSISGMQPSCVLLNDGRVFIGHRREPGTLDYLYHSIVSIDGDNMTSITEPFTTQPDFCRLEPCCATLSNGRVLILFGAVTLTLKAAVYSGKKVEKYRYQETADVYNKIFGIAKTSGSVGDTIEVYVPNITNS